MEYNLPEKVLSEIRDFARKSGVQKVILFGSRAKGTHTERSDVDLAVIGGNFKEFQWNIEERVHSLLSIDVINLDSEFTDEFKEEIQKEGVTIYEKA